MAGKEEGEGKMQVYVCTRQGYIMLRQSKLTP